MNPNFDNQPSGDPIKDVLEAGRRVQAERDASVAQQNQEAIASFLEETFPEDESVRSAPDFTSLSRVLDELSQKELSGERRQSTLSKLSTAKRQIAYISEALNAADRGTIEAVLRNFETPNEGAIPEDFGIRKKVADLLYQKKYNTTPVDISI